MSIPIEVKINGYSTYGMTSKDKTEAIVSIANILASGDVAKVVIEKATATEMTVAGSTE